MKIKLGIAGKLISAIEISVILVTIFSFITTYFLLIEVFRQQTFSKLESVTTLKVNGIESFLEETSSEIEFFNNRPTVRQYILSYLAHGDTASKNVIESRINDLLQYRKIYTDILILDKDGLVVYSSNAADEGKIKSTEAFFIGSLEKTYVQEYFFDAASGSTVMMVGTPIKSEEGEVIGVLAGKMDVTTISDLMAIHSGLGSTGETFLINSYNTVTTDLLKEPGMAMKKTIFLPQIENCLNGNDGQFDMPDYKDDRVLGVSKWIPSLKSCMITKIDYTEVVTPIRRVVESLLLVMIAGSVVLGIFGYLLAMTVVSPIKKLHEAMKRIKEGSFDVESDVVSNDEIGEMSKTFNEMTEELKTSYASLEEKVAEKTKSLNDKLEEVEKMNKLMVGRELRMMELKKEISELQEKSKTR